MQEREREAVILRLLSVRNYVHINDVAEATNASEATLRRDFKRMEDSGRLRRVRGGIEPLHTDGDIKDNSFEPPFYSRININIEQKRRIAKAACSELRDGEIIMIDGGTTSYHMVEFMPAYNLNVVTNSLAIAEYLTKYSNCIVSLPEGNVDTESMLLLNNLNSDPFINYNASKVFMGIEGITSDRLTNSKPQFIQTKLAMIKHSKELIILADETKFGKVGLLTLCGVEKVSKIITTKEANTAILQELRKKNIEIVIV